MIFFPADAASDFFFGRFPPRGPLCYVICLLFHAYCLYICFFRFHEIINDHQAPSQKAVKDFACTFDKRISPLLHKKFNRAIWNWKKDENVMVYCA